jgi:hypothetical protein
MAHDSHGAQQGLPGGWPGGPGAPRPATRAHLSLGSGGGRAAERLGASSVKETRREREREREREGGEQERGRARARICGSWAAARENRLRGWGFGLGRAPPSSGRAAGSTVRLRGPAGQGGGAAGAARRRRRVAGRNLPQVSTGSQVHGSPDGGGGGGGGGEGRRDGRCSLRPVPQWLAVAPVVCACRWSAWGWSTGRCGYLKGLGCILVVCGLAGDSRRSVG